MMAEDGDRMRSASLAFLGAEKPSPRGPQAEHLEIVARNEEAVDDIRLTVIAQRRLDPHPGEQTLEDRELSERFVVGVRRSTVQRAAEITGEDLDQLRRPVSLQRAEQQRVRHAEQDGRGADAHGQRRDRNGAETRRLPDQPETIAHVIDRPGWDQHGCTTDWWPGRLTADGDFSPVVLLYGENLDVSFAPQHLNSDVLGVAREQEVHIPVADRQVREANPLDTVWKHGAPE